MIYDRKDLISVRTRHYLCIFLTTTFNRRTDFSQLWHTCGAGWRERNWRIIGRERIEKRISPFVAASSFRQSLLHRGMRTNVVALRVQDEGRKENKTREERKNYFHRVASSFVSCKFFRSAFSYCSDSRARGKISQERTDFANFASTPWLPAIEFFTRAPPGLIQL